MVKQGRARGAFTLVEVLIVVIVLGILAAVVVPQFADATADARMSALTTNLATIRGQIQLYKMQHNDTYPALATFANQMTLYTDISGNTNATKTAVFKYGPYLLSVPNNPYTNTNDVTNTAVDPAKAWNYDAATGVFKANDTAAHAAL